MMCLSTGTSNNHCFPFGTNGKVVVLGVPILKTLGYYPEIIINLGTLQPNDDVLKFWDT